MDFTPTPQVESLLERIREFNEEHVYPVEMDLLSARDEEVTVQQGRTYGMTRHSRGTCSLRAETWSQADRRRLLFTISTRRGSSDRVCSSFPPTRAHSSGSARYP